MSEQTRIIKQIKIPNQVEPYDIHAFDSDKLGGKTLADIELLIAGGVDYLGLASAATEVVYKLGMNNGDFYRAGADFTLNGQTVKSGDLILADSVDTANQTVVWAVIHGGEFDMSHVHNFAHTHEMDHTHNFELEDTSISVQGVAAGNVAISVGTGTANYTPAGNITINYGDKNADTSANSASVDVVTNVTVDDPTVTFGTHPTAKAATALNTTTINNPTVTNVNIPNVTNATDVTVSAVEITDVIIPNVTGNTAVEASKVTEEVKSIPNVTSCVPVIASHVTVETEEIAIERKSVSNITNGGTAANWAASVSDNILTFDWTPNTLVAYETVQASTVGAVEIPKVTVDEVTTSKVTLGSPIDVSKVTIDNVEASKVTLGAALNASKVTKEDIVASKVELGAAISASQVATTGVSVATGIKTTADALTGLGTATVNHGITVSKGTAAAVAHAHKYDKVIDAIFVGTGVYLKAAFTGSTHTAVGTYKKLKSITMFDGATTQSSISTTGTPINA